MKWLIKLWRGYRRMRLDYERKHALSEVQFHRERVQIAERKLNKLEDDEHEAMSRPSPLFGRK